MMIHRWLKLTVCVALLVAVCCTCAMADEPAPPQPIGPISQVGSLDLSGTWEGRWESCSTHHQGPLRASICRIDDTHYRVVFHGRFLVVLPFRYAVTLEVVGSDADSVQLTGSAYLGKVFGCFHYTATAGACQLNADYASCKESGRFVLCRKTVCTALASNIVARHPVLTTSEPTCGCR